MKTIIGYEVPEQRSLSYYFPFFLKNGIIYYEDSTLDLTKVETSCSDKSCMYCNQLDPENCLKCSTSYFLKDQKCVNFCPEAFYADTLRGRCVSDQIENQDVNFMRAYTTGSCKNMCGRNLNNSPNLLDCCCDTACKNRGDCCSDYVSHKCDNLIDRAKMVKTECRTVPGCDLCDAVDKVEGFLKCNQCESDLYLYLGKCFRKCPPETYKDEVTKTCHKIPRKFFITQHAPLQIAKYV